MNYLYNFISVGIDVAADSSWICIITPDGKEFAKPFKVNHFCENNLRNAVKSIKKAEKLYSTNSKIFLESTGIYHLPLFCYLKNLGFDVSVINPLISNSNKNVGIRKVKNDKFDSRRIANLGYDPTLKVSLIPTELILNLRSLCREYYSLVDYRSSYIIKLKSNLRLVFPGYVKVFSNIAGVTSLAILKKFSTPENIINSPSSELINFIALHSRKGIKNSKKSYDKLLAAAKSALNFRCNINSIFKLISIQIQFIEEYNNKINLILSNIRDFVTENKSEPFIKQIHLIDSIPGVGFLSAVTLMCEIGDFNSFSKPKQLFAYFGVDPSVYESGEFKGTKNKMSKRGSRIGRRVLFSIALASVNIKRCGNATNPVLRTYYQNKKLSKPKKVALGVVMHKVSNIIFAVLRENKPFEHRTPEEHKQLYNRKVA